MPLLEVKRRVGSGQVDVLAKHGYDHIKLLGSNPLDQFAVETLDIAQNLLDLVLDETSGPLLHSDGSTVRQATAIEVATTFPTARDADGLALEQLALKSDTGNNCRPRRAMLEVIRRAVNLSLPEGQQIDEPTMRQIWEGAVEAID
tara:strand:+ start:257 stop:694 length:438 start_codon:yes stop_codon:yes gene_type:complete